MAHSSRTLMGTKTRIAGAIATLTTAFAAFTMPAASATDSAVVTVSNAQLQKADDNGNGLEGEIHEGDVVALTFDWASQQPTSGDHISVKLPSYLSNLESSHSEQFSFSRNGVSTRVGDCRFAEQSFNCTFDRGIDEIRAQGFANPAGRIKVLLRATQATQSNTGQFVVNGEKVDTQIPGGSIRSKPQASYEPLNFSMASGTLSSTSRVVPWTINFGSDYVSQSLAASGGSLALDGKTKSTLPITGQLGAGQSFATSDGAWVLTQTNSAQDPNNDERILLTDSSGRDHTKEHGDFDLSVTYEGDQAKLTVAGPWAAGTNYSLNFAATLDDAEVTPDFEYTSSASIDGTSVAASASRTYTRPFASTVSLQSGFGGFEIGGLVGQQAQAFPSGTVLPVTVEYALPGGATVDSYPGWQAPGSVARSGTGGVATIDVAVGQKINFPATFPAGTQVRLAIDASRASSQVNLQHLEFNVAQRTTSKLTITSEATTSVTISAQASSQSSSPQASQEPAATEQAEQQQPDPGQSTSTTQAPEPAQSQAPEAAQSQAPEPAQSQAPEPDAAVTAQEQAPAPEGPAESENLGEGDSQAPDAQALGDATSNEDGTPGDDQSAAPSAPSEDDADRFPYSPSDESSVQAPSAQPSSDDDNRISLSPDDSGNPDPDTADDPGPAGGSSDQLRADEASDSSDSASSSDGTSGDASSQPTDAPASDSAVADPSANEPSVSADAASPSEPTDQTQASELSPLEALGVESEEDFLLRTEDFPFSDDGSRRGSVGPGSDVELDLKPLPTVRPKANDGQILSTGMGMSAGVISAIILGLLGSALVLRRYFE